MVDPYPLVLLAIGIFTIFLLILYFRVHAFLALIAAAMLVALLSPRVVTVPGPIPKDPKTYASAVALMAGGGGPALAASAVVSQQPAQYELLEAPKQVGFAFGSLLGRIGLIIAFATIVGKALMDSGGADRIVRAFLWLFGERFAGLALLFSGFVLAIPVFFDTVFFLLVPLAKALRIRTGKNYLFYITAIGAGGAITHSLVPPTPGPIAMAEYLNVDLGWTILMGLIVGFPLAFVGFGWAALANKLWPVPLRQVGEVTLEELEKSAHRPDSELPSLFASIMPIVLPVVLITMATIFETVVRANPGLNEGWMVGGRLVTPLATLQFIGQRDIALLLAAVVAMWLVAKQKNMNRKQLGAFTGQALDEAGLILLITAAGGSFGAMLLKVGVGDSLRELTAGSVITPLILAWGMGALFKIAQGSGTVSMITSAQIMRDIIDKNAAEQNISAAAFLGYDPVYIVMAIGVGSKIGSWMNDSGFWVVCRMSGMTEGETFKSWTMCLVVMGIAGLPIVWLLTQVMPMVP